MCNSAYLQYNSQYISFFNFLALEKDEIHIYCLYESMYYVAYYY